MTSHAVVTRTGLVSPLGLDVRASAAAARAGISRATTADYFQVFGEADGEPQAVSVHAIRSLARGFEGRARQAVLAKHVLSELSSSMEGEVPGPTGFYLSLPAPDRHLSLLELIHDDETRVAWEELKETHPAVEEDTEEFARGLLRGAGLGAVSVRFVTTRGGHTGFPAVLSRALADLGAGTVELAVVGACDSLTGEETLTWLEDTGRLKTPNRPCGVPPGEAAAFIVVTTEEAAQRAGDEPWLRVHEVVSAQEADTLGAGGPGLGRSLGDCLAAAARSATLKLPWLYTDMNGEAFRARELANACNRARQVAEGLDFPEVRYPAISFGDTGAASAAVSICLAREAYLRGYCSSPGVVVGSSGDSGERAALALSVAEGWSA